MKPSAVAAMQPHASIHFALANVSKLAESGPVRPSSLQTG